MIMKLIKKGRIYDVDNRIDWATNSVLTPNPFLLDDDTIRVYASFRDDYGVGRIGYIDVRASNPKEIVRISQKPVLDIGEDGMFDDNGMLLGDVIRVGDDIYMYYVGFQIPKKAKFITCSGLAISHDGGETFERVQQTPIAGRVPNAPFGRCIHTVLYDRGIFRIWYSVIQGWHYVNGKPYPKYDIRYVESKDGMHIFDDEGILCLPVGENEYRIGRPRVIKRDDKHYEMRFTADTYDKQYISGIAYSSDGIHWDRHDEDGLLKPSKEGWDSEMACYPVELETQYGTYLFYDGNGMGATGFGYAELIK